MKIIRIALAIGLIFAIRIPAFCGLLKTGGNFEVQFDVINGSGSASPTGGNFAVYQAVGQVSGYEILSGGAFEVTGGFLGVVDETPPDIAFTAPTAASNNSGSVSIIGTAFDANDAQWTLSYGPGSSPTTWKQLSTGASNVSGATLISWDTAQLSGTYTLAITATDSRGNTATGTVTFSLDNTATITGNIPDFTWVMISVPVQPSPPDPISMFGSGEYKIYRWDSAATPSPAGTSQFAYPASLTAGDAFWIKSYAGAMPYSYSGGVVDTTQDYAISLKTGWNQVGTPFQRDYPWGMAQVRSGGSVYDITTAASMGLISTVLYSYDSEANSWVQNDTTANMVQQTGYDLYAYSDVDLLLGPGAGLAGGLMRQVREVYDYELKISARAAQSADLDNYIGSSSSAQDGHDGLDAPEPPKSLADKYTALYFNQAQSPAPAGRYANDMRPLARSAGESRTWDMVVQTNETGQTVTLTWDSAALPTDRFSFTLVDLATGAQIDMSAQGSYSYVASGAEISEARFRIQVVKLTAEGVTSSVTLRPGWNLISVPLETEVTDALSQLGDNLPLLNVYQYFDGQFYGNESADIQAGLGFWIHVADSTVIDFTGIPLAADQSVTVPLKPGWNLIGNPFAEEMIWGDNITVDCGTGAVPLEQAAAANAVSARVFLYDGAAYVPQDMGSALQPWKGYFIKATLACDLILAR